MGRRERHDLVEMLHVNIDTAGKKCAAASDGEAEGIDRIIDRTERGGLGFLAELAGGRVLPLGQAVDTVVQENDVDIDVATQDVDGVIAADGEQITIAGDEPYLKIGIGELDPGGEGGCPPVNRVHAVGIDVVGKACGASDARNENKIFLLSLQLGQGLAHGGEHGIITAPRTPANVLISGEVLGGIRWNCSVRHNDSPSFLLS